MEVKSCFKKNFNHFKLNLFITISFSLVEIELIPTGYGYYLPYQQVIDHHLVPAVSFAYYPKMHVFRALAFFFRDILRDLVPFGQFKKCEIHP